MSEASDDAKQAIEDVFPLAWFEDICRITGYPVERADEVRNEILAGPSTGDVSKVQPH